MFVAWRDLRFARGRFFLIGTVVALITLLVGFLSGLTGGLASQNISAVLQLPGERVVLQNPGDGAPDYATSSISNETGEAWIAADGVETVLPLGIAQARAENTSGSATAAEGTVGVALFGMMIVHIISGETEDGLMPFSWRISSGSMVLPASRFCGDT